MTTETAMTTTEITERWIDVLPDLPLIPGVPIRKSGCI